MERSQPLTLVALSVMLTHIVRAQGTEQWARGIESTPVIRLPDSSMQLAQCRSVHPDDCSYAHQGTIQLSGSDPCIDGNHIVVSSPLHRYQKYKQDSDKHSFNLPFNQWMLFRDADGGACMDISDISQALKDDGYCFMPGYCDTNIPWYVVADEPIQARYNTTGTERVVTLCMTDMTSLQNALCCQEPTRMVVRSCGAYNVYKSLNHISVRGAICGRATTEIRPSRNVIGLRTALEVPLTYLIKHASPTLQPVSTLPIEQCEQIYSVSIRSLSSQHFWGPSIIDIYSNIIVEGLNKYMEIDSAVKRHKAVVFTTTDVHRILGSPQYFENGVGLNFTFYISKGNTTISHRLIETVHRHHLKDTELSVQTLSHIIFNGQGLIEGAIYPLPYASNLNNLITNRSASVQSLLKDTFGSTKSSAGIIPGLNERVDADWSGVIYIIVIPLSALFVILLLVLVCIIIKYQKHRIPSRKSSIETSSSIQLTSHGKLTTYITGTHNVSPGYSTQPQTCLHVINADGDDASLSVDTRLCDAATFPIRISNRRPLDAAGAPSVKGDLRAPTDQAQATGLKVSFQTEEPQDGCDALQRIHIDGNTVDMTQT